MRLVREEQGPEAVILSTRRLADGIELIAAIDYDESLINEAVRQGHCACRRGSRSATHGGAGRRRRATRRCP